MLSTSAAVFSLLLILTGVAKIRRPTDVESAVKQLGLPSFRGFGIALGSTEFVVGAVALVVPNLLVGQAVMYAAFGMWVFVALSRSIPLASCGCLGRDDTPPTAAHAVLNFIAVAVSLGALFGESFVILSGLGGVAQLVVITTAVFLSYMVLTEAAQLKGVRAR